MCGSVSGKNGCKCGAYGLDGCSKVFHSKKRSNPLRDKGFGAFVSIFAVIKKRIPYREN